MINKKAREIFSDEQFEKIFKKRFGEIFSVFLDWMQERDPKGNYLMDSCKTGHGRPWKLFCCVFPSPNRNFSFPASAASNVLESICDGWKSEKARLESEMTEICGNGYQDPESKIHKAWLLYKHAIKQIDDFFLEKPVFSERYLNEFIDNYLFLVAPEKSQLSDEETYRRHNKFIEGAKKRECFINHDIHDWVELALRKRNLENNLKKYSKGYWALENRRCKILELIESGNVLIEKSPRIALRAFCDAHKLKLANIKNWLILEKFMDLDAKLFFYKLSFGKNSVDLVERMRNLIKILPQEVKMPIWKALYLDVANGAKEELFVEHHFHELLGPLYREVGSQKLELEHKLKRLCAIPSIALIEHEDSPALDKIRMTINACSVGKEIWETLYQRCAEGKVEDRWSENHFPEFLPCINDIIRVFHYQADQAQNEELKMELDFLVGLLTELM